MPLYGYCQTGCIDNGSSSPSFDNPPKYFGFTADGAQAGPQLVFIILIPSNQPVPIGLNLSGTFISSFTQFGVSPWTSGMLADYLGITAGPNNPLGALLPVSQAFDPGTTGFYILRTEVSGWDGLNDVAYPNISPILALNNPLPIGSWILAFINVGTIGQPNWIATANSAGIFIGYAPGATPAVRGIAKGSSIIRNEDNLAVLGIKPKGVAAKGAVVYRAKTVVVGKWRLLASASAAGTSLTLDTTGANLFIITTAAFGAAIASINSDTYNAIGLSGVQGLVQVQGAGRPASYIAMIPATGRSGPNHTWTVTSAPYASFQVLAYQIDTDPTSVFGNGASSATTSPGSVTPYGAEPLIITAIAAESNITAAPNGFELIKSQPYITGVTIASAVASSTPPTAATVTPSSWTIGGGTVSSTVASLTAYVF